ncbi:MAG: hypothetical protein D8M59_07710 [Planctomycetes bacterium]|nr:hypothetical protein [Planctomycetota bacterium]
MMTSIIVGTRWPNITEHRLSEIPPRPGQFGPRLSYKLQLKVVRIPDHPAGHPGRFVISRKALLYSALRRLNL